LRKRRFIVYNIPRQKVSLTFFAPREKIKLREAAFPRKKGAGPPAGPF
jgi:hypothetical protein